MKKFRIFATFELNFNWDLIGLHLSYLQWSNLIKKNVLLKIGFADRSQVFSCWAGAKPLGPLLFCPPNRWNNSCCLFVFHKNCWIFQIRSRHFFTFRIFNYYPGSVRHALSDNFNERNLKISWISHSRFNLWPLLGPHKLGAHWKRSGSAMHC